MHIYCDESGNTGTDLLDTDQPLFALASTCLSRDQCEMLIAPLLRQGQTEAKYSRLKGTARGQRSLVEFFSSPQLTASTAKTLLADKRYYVITQIVDKLIEPPLHEAGLDLYSGDGHIALANLWYYAGHSILPNGHWDRVLRAALRSMRERTAAAYDDFDRAITAAASAAPSKNKDLTSGLLLARGRLREFIGVFGDSPAFDPAVDIFISLINEWMSQHSGQLRVTHDQSKPLWRSRQLLQALMTPTTSRWIGYGERRAELPLRISSLDFGDSVRLPQLQVADLFAGAAIDCTLAWSGRRAASAYHAAMRATSLAQVMRGGMLPSPTLIRANEQQEGQVSLVDGSAHFLKEVGYFKPTA